MADLTRKVVVGDRFEEFLHNRGAISASTALTRLRSGAPPAELEIGQGLTVEQRYELAELIGDAAVVPTGAERSMTHKHDPKNVMIGRPVRVDDVRFEADLVIDERNETLEDHITGQHIPAIALTEAARQMWTAVSEEFLLDTHGEPVRFVVIAIDSRFVGYVFPLAATVHLELLARTDTGVGESFTCLIEVRQGPRTAVEVRGEYRVVPEAVSAKQESMAARRALTVTASATDVAGRRPA